MNKGKYARGNSRKALLVLLALVMVIGCTVGGTLAWLTAKSEQVVNTFVVGDIGTLTLTEEPDTPHMVNGQYVIVPGVNLTKNALVSYTDTVDKAGEYAVPVYVFVKVDAPEWTKDITTEGANVTAIKYSVGEVYFNLNLNWIPLDGVENVYYQELDAEEFLENEPILTEDGKVTVPGTIEKDDLSDIADAASSVTFSAYAIQQKGIEDKNSDDSNVAEAWELVSTP